MLLADVLYAAAVLADTPPSRRNASARPFIFTRSTTRATTPGRPTGSPPSLEEARPGVEGVRGLLPATMRRLRRSKKPQGQGQDSPSFSRSAHAVLRRVLVPCAALLFVPSLYAVYLDARTYQKADMSQAPLRPDTTSVLMEGPARQLLRASTKPYAAPVQASGRPKSQLSSWHENTTATAATAATTSTPTSEKPKPKKAGTGTSRRDPLVLFEDHHDQYARTTGHFITRFFHRDHHRTDEQTQEILFDILKFARDTCHALGIRFLLKSGTLLGAWRHHASIPWDVDIDILFTSEQVEKLKVAFRANNFMDGHPSASEYQWIIRKGLHSDIIAMKLAHITSGLYVDCFVVYPHRNRKGAYWEDRWPPSFTYPNDKLFPPRPCVFGTSTRRGVFDCPREPLFMLKQLYGNNNTSILPQQRRKFPVLIEFTGVAATIDDARALLAKAKANLREQPETFKQNNHHVPAVRAKIMAVLNSTKDDWSFYVQ